MKNQTGGGVEMEEQEKLLRAILDDLGVINITLCRIYDVQMALLAGADPETAKMIDNIHTEGKFIGSVPSIGAEDPFGS